MFGDHTVDQDSVLVDRRVVDLNALQVEVLGVVLLDETLGNVRNVHASIAFTSDVHLVALHAEGVDEATPKVVELVGDVNLVLGSPWTGRETSAGGLVNVDNVGQVVPRVHVADRLVDAGLPEERTVLLQQAVEGAASWAAVQPDGDLLLGVWVGRGEEPEEQTGLAMGCVGQVASVRLADVEVDRRNGGAIDEELCYDRELVLVPAAATTTTTIIETGLLTLGGVGQILEAACLLGLDAALAISSRNQRVRFPCSGSFDMRVALQGSACSHERREGSEDIHVA